ncbi:CMGC/CDK protein kinase [Amanita muscaria]
MYQYGFADDLDDDDCYSESVDDGFFLVERGPVSTVRKTLKSGFGGPDEDLSVPRWLAVKTSTTNHKFSRQPHDIVKEVRLLSGLSHVNIITLFDYIDDQPSVAMHLWMPFMPFSFYRILGSPTFSPFPSPSISLPPLLPRPTNPISQASLTSRFLVLSKSLTFQIISAIAYLHSPTQCIAHRDIKPRNLLITEQGCVKLIDFGVSWKSDDTEKDQESDLWPERKEDMCAAVSTGPYRAPELLFGAKSYNAFSTDLWSLGTTLAELFTSLALTPSSPSSSDDEDTDRYSQPGRGHDAVQQPPFILPPSISVADDENEYKWTRSSLFNGTRGELGLIWSIFKTMGTPTETSWPGYKDLLSPTSITFKQVPGVPLESLLPNLPPSLTPTSRTHALDLICRLLVYPPGDRLIAQDALNHPWLTSNDEVPLLLPPDYVLRQEQKHLKSQVVINWDGKSLEDLVKEVLDSDTDEEK